MDEAGPLNEHDDESREPLNEKHVDPPRQSFEAGSEKPPAPKAASTRESASLPTDPSDAANDPCIHASRTLDLIEVELENERLIG